MTEIKPTHSSVRRGRGRSNPSASIQRRIAFHSTLLESAEAPSNLPLIIGLVLLILGIIILGWFLYNKNKKETKPKEETTPLKNLENQRQMGSNMPATDKQMSVTSVNPDFVKLPASISS